MKLQVWSANSHRKKNKTYRNQSIVDDEIFRLARKYSTKILPTNKHSTTVNILISSLLTDNIWWRNKADPARSFTNLTQNVSPSTNKHQQTFIYFLRSIFQPLGCNVRYLTWIHWKSAVAAGTFNKLSTLT